MASESLKVFRHKMANPVHWRKANRVFLKYQKVDLETVAGARKVIDDLAQVLQVPLSAAEKTQAAQWLARQGIDPQSRRQRLMLWRRVKS